MIYDCFTFFDELDLLEIRLHELDSVVDKFVLVESNVTFTNRPKPLVFDAHKKRFQKFRKKIIHIIVDDSPNVRLPWLMEHYQYSQILRGLKNAKPDDVILVSCIDEIPKKELITKYMHAKGKHKGFDQRFYTYYFNCEAYGKGSTLSCTSMYRYKDLRTYKDPYIARFSPFDLEIPEGGWHFRNLGDVKWIQNKLNAWSHQEYNNDAYNTPERIQRYMREGKDFFKDSPTYRFVPYTHLPFYIQENPEKFAKFLIHTHRIPSLGEKLFFEFKSQARVMARKVVAPFRS